MENMDHVSFYSYLLLLFYATGSLHACLPFITLSIVGTSRFTIVRESGGSRYSALIGYGERFGCLYQSVIAA